MRRSRMVLCILTAVAAAGFGTALGAALFDHANPGPGTVLAASPGRIDVYTRHTTSAEPGATQMIVIDRNQHHVDSGQTTIDPADHHHFSVALQPDLAPGRYVVDFKTLGEQDLERDGGNYAFYVGVQPTSADRAADATLHLTTVTGDEGLTGYRRGIVEGGLTALIGVPAAFYYIQRRRRKAAREAEPVDRVPPV